MIFERCRKYSCTAISEQLKSTRIYWAIDGREPWVLLIDCQVHNALYFDRFGGKKAIIFDRRECSLLFKLGHLVAVKRSAFQCKRAARLPSRECPATAKMTLLLARAPLCSCVESDRPGCSHEVLQISVVIVTKVAKWLLTRRSCMFCLSFYWPN